MRRLLVSLVLATALAIAAVSPALGAPLFREHYSGTDTFTSDFCGTTWEAVNTFEGLFILKEGRKRDPTPYVFDNFSYRIVWTDVNDPSRVWMQEGNGLYKDLRITRVEGTLYHFESIEVGQPFTMRTADGDIVLRDRGYIRRSFVVDTLGDSNLDNDIFHEFIEAIVRGPHPVFHANEEEFCAGVAEAVGG